MSGLLLITLIVGLWGLSQASAIHLILSLLIVSCVCGISITHLSVWNGALLILTYGGGLLVLIVYLASLTQWKTNASINLLALLVVSEWLVEQGHGASLSSASFFLTNSKLELVWVLILLSLVCLLVGQVLLCGSCLRSTVANTSFIVVIACAIFSSLVIAKNYLLFTLLFLDLLGLSLLLAASQTTTSVLVPLIVLLVLGATVGVTLLLSLVRNLGNDKMASFLF